MKLGDTVMSTKTRPYEKATIIQIDISNRLVNGKKQVRTKYIAQYADTSLLNFAGASINRTVFLSEEPDGQMSLEDFADEIVGM